ncbi:MAG: permease-like cell division protein FtsX [bacterium]
MFLSLKRIIRSGWVGFYRNNGLSMATVFILVMTISLATSLFLIRNISDQLIASLREKVDISVYFKKDCAEAEILALQEKLEDVQEIKSVKYVSKDEAMQIFVERHKDDLVLIESLQEVGTNPFFSSLNIKAVEAAQYDVISEFLAAEHFREIIEDIDYYKKKPIIDKLFAVTYQVNRVGIILASVLAVVAVLLVFNQVKLAIYNKKEEIEVMKLVGSSNWFVRGPFIVQGVIAGVLSAMVAVLLWLGITFFLGPKLIEIIPGSDIFQYFLDNILLIFLVQLAIGVGLGVLSSMIAIRKYLKI